MTNLEALQSMTEYNNDNLLAKALLDQGVSAGGTYTAANEENIDLAAARVYFALAAHPKLKEGSSYTEYDAKQLRGMAKAILRKYDDHDANISGTAKW